MKKKIVVVDDNITSLTIVKNMMAGIHDAIPVTSGEQALVIIEKITPDLVLLDIEMPGMDGFETLSELRKLNIDIPVVFLSGNDDCEEDIKAAGALSYIKKPVGRQTLIDAIQKYAK